MSSPPSIGGRNMSAAASSRRPARDPYPADVVPSVHLAAVGITKSYRKGTLEIPVLSGVNLMVEEGEFLAIVGQSGSGKSTLLHLLGTLDSPDQGEIYFQGNRIDN